MDFFALPLDEKYDTIIGNPPYVRFQDIPHQTLARLDGEMFDRRSNLYLHFIEKAVRHLRRGGEHQVRPRVLTTAADDWLWDAAVGLATRRLRRVRSGVLLQRVRAGRPSAEQAAVSTGRAPVFLRGEPGELVLWLYGRGAAAEVEFVGGADEVAKLQQLSLSI